MPGVLLKNTRSSQVIIQTTTGPGRVHLLKEVVTAALPGGGELSLVRKRLPSRTARGSILLLHGFAQNRYTWHLQRRSFSAYMAARGYDVFNLELRGIGRSRVLGAPAPQSFDEHIDEDLPYALEAMRRVKAAEPVFLMGHSLGGAVAYAASPRLDGQVAGVVTLSGVFCWGQGARAVSGLSRILHRADRMHHALGLGAGVPIRMDWVGRLVAGGLRVFDTPWVPMPTEGWAPRSVEQEILREWLTRAFDRTSGSVLALMGRWARTGDFCATTGQRDYAREWASSKIPVLVIGADRDRLAHPYEDVRPAFEASTARDKTYRCFGSGSARGPYGHVDLLIGRHAPDEVWPFVADWLNTRT